MIGSFIATLVLSGITAALIGLYLLPVLLAWARHVPDIGMIAVINILLGWTLAGWVVALALSLRSVVHAAPAVQLFQQLPPPSAPPQPGTGWPGPPAPGPSAPPSRRPDAAPPLILPPHPTEMHPEEPQRSGEDGEPQWPAPPR